jgi:hypothetical protein
VKLLFRLVLLPFKLALAAVGTVFRAGLFAGGLPVRAGRRTSRLLGFRGSLGLLVGVVLGLAFAPGPGREFRAQIKRLLDRGPSVSDNDLADRVSFELEHAPRTWHLPQPSVTVVQGRVVLSGAAPQPAARDELARVAAAVPGVSAVDNLVVVADGTEVADAESE